MDVVTGGYPNSDVLDYGKLKEAIDNLEGEKPWDLTNAERKKIEEGFEKIRRGGGQELSLRDADKITAGHPIIEGEEYGE